MLISGDQIFRMTLINVPELSRVGNQAGKESEYKAKQWKEKFRFLTNILTAKFRLKLKNVGKTTRPFRYGLNQIPYDFTVEVRNRFKGLDLIECLMNY